jgi:hypothetical protein
MQDLLPSVHATQSFFLLLPSEAVACFEYPTAFHQSSPSHFLRVIAPINSYFSFVDDSMANPATLGSAVLGGVDDERFRG